MQLLRFSIVTILVLFFSSQKVHAQEEYSKDAALWLSLNLEKKINKKITLNLSQQNRINENISQYGRGNIDLGITYRLIKNIRLTTGYVYLKRPFPNNSFTNEHRAYVSLLLKKNAGRWDFSYRNMVQMRMKNIYSSENGMLPKFYERNKLSIKYELTKFVKPYVSQEFFYPLNQTQNKGFNKSRSILGLEFNLNRKTQLETYFLFQKELNAFNTTELDYVYGLSFSYEL